MARTCCQANAGPKGPRTRLQWRTGRRKPSTNQRTSICFFPVRDYRYVYRSPLSNTIFSHHSTEDTSAKPSTTSSGYRFIGAVVWSAYTCAIAPTTGLPVSRCMGAWGEAHQLCAFGSVTTTFGYGKMTLKPTRPGQDTTIFLFF